MFQGAFDLSRNLFPNQFNVALNIAAAKFVFERFREFSHFISVPSHTTQRVKFSPMGLVWQAKSLERRILGFNLHLEAREALNVTDPSKLFEGKAFLMPDLTALLCAFTGFRGSSIRHADVTDQNGVLVLTYGDSSGIPVCELPEDVVLDEKEVKSLLRSFTIDKDSL